MYAQPREDISWLLICEVAQMRTVQLPADLCSLVEKRYGSAFGSLEELLIFVLKDLANDDAVKADQAERQIIEERLKDLGYL